MIKCLFLSPPFNFFLNKEVGGGWKRVNNKLTRFLGKTSSSPKSSQFKTKFKLELRKMKLIKARTMLVEVLDMFLNFKPYRNPSLLNRFEFGG